MKTCIYQKIKSHLVHKCSQVHYSQKVKRIQCPLAKEWINNLWHINTVEYSLAIKNENMDKNTMLSEINQPQKATYYMIPF